MDKLKKLTTCRLFWPLVCLFLVLLFNFIKSPSFFKISVNNGVLYGYLVDIFNRSSELIILAVGMTLCVASVQEPIFPSVLQWLWQEVYLYIFWEQEIHIICRGFLQSWPDFLSQSYAECGMDSW